MWLAVLAGVPVGVFVGAGWMRRRVTEDVQHAYDLGWHDSRLGVAYRKVL